MSGFDPWPSGSVDRRFNHCTTITTTVHSPDNISTTPEIFLLDIRMKLQLDLGVENGRDDIFRGH